ncbi:Methyltransferase-like protein 4 [Oryzias melastigma]|uniref:Methyltransferase-like protein 4 n=1 Tax=Oryzias melastigma TaxID=30732 RepID=A0A834FNY2_ORYME|nr:Methyltransferase-like protein 4 [Oryzias melastigma]
MSVVFQSSPGWVLNALPLINASYQRCVRIGNDGSNLQLKCTFNRQYFQISKSYYNQSPSAAPDGGKADIFQAADKQSKKRKRKRSELNQGEIDSQAFHQRVRSVILEGTKSLVASAQSCGYLNGDADAEKEALLAPECGLAALCEMAKDLPPVDVEEHVQPLITEGGCTTNIDLFSRVTEHNQDCAAAVTLMGQEYVIPPRTAFMLSDVTRMKPLVDYEKIFDVIVMDPPWENKSLKRSRRYSSLPSSQLKRLPIPQLASPNCLVVTWVTNRPSHLRFVCDELYPHWNVQVVAKWFWVKVTTLGQFVFPLDSQHKKPYETLVLGRYRPSASPSVSEMKEVLIEDNRLIVSVPSALHSQKPSLSEVLKAYIRPGAECLELFARSLQPGWTSWGNEVLKFQHSSYFTLTPADDPADTSKEEAPDGPSAAPALRSPHHAN